MGQWTSGATRGRLTRRRVLTGMVGLGATLLAACGGNGDRSDSSASTGTRAAKDAGASQSPTATVSPLATVAAATPSAPATVSQLGSVVTVVYWDAFGGDRGKLVQEIVQRFNATQSDVRVDYQFQGNYDETGQKLLQALAAKQTPDVVLLADNWWFRFYLAGALQPLDDLLRHAGVDLDDYVKPFLVEGIRKGQLYWLPFARSTPLFYYNKAAWQEAGLPDRGPATWDEFIQWAPQLLKQASGQVTRFAYGHPAGAGTTAGSLTSTISWNFQSIVWQWGGRYSDENLTIHFQEQPAVEAGRRYLLEGVKAGWAIASGNVDGDFINGRVAALVASTAQLAGYEKSAGFAVGTATLPAGPAGFACCTGGSGFAILAGKPTVVQQAAARFLAFATSPEMAAFWAQGTGYVPVRHSAVQGAAMQQLYQQRPNFKTAVEQLPQARSCDPAREWIPNGYDVIGRGLERVLTQRDDPATVFAEVAKQLAAAATPVLEQLQRRES